MKTLLLLALVPLALGWPTGGDRGSKESSSANPYVKQEKPQGKGDEMDQWMESMWRKFMETHKKMEFEGTISVGGNDEKEDAEKQDAEKDDAEKEGAEKQDAEKQDAEEEDDEKQDSGKQGRGKEQKQRPSRREREQRGRGDSSEEEEERHWGKAQQQRGWGRQDDDEEEEKLFEEFQEWARAKKIKENMEAQKKKEQLAEEFEEWKREQMIEHMKEWKEESEKQEREKQMEALKEKSQMVQKLANLTQQFQEQKLKLVHDVTSQFLEFCKCSETKEMMKKFFTESFGQMTPDDDWSLAVGDGEETMGQQMGSTTSSPNNPSTAGGMNYPMGGNGTAPGGNGTAPRGNGTAPGGNGTAPGGNGTTQGANNPPSADGSSSLTYQEWQDQQQFEASSKKFAQMNQKERSHELFNGMVKALCERADEYVQHIKKFEAYYVKHVADSERNDD